MSVFDDPKGKLSWLEEELLEDEEDPEEEAYEDDEPEDEEILLRPRMRRRKRMCHAVYADESPMDDREAIFVEKQKRKGTGNWGLKFLIFLEILGILAVVWWWIKWLY